MTRHVDVLIVGAGLSGIDAAYRLQTLTRGKTYVILEARDAIGGTWDLFRYPGIRSDSDMFTLGYPFRPWRSRRAISDGASVRDYIRDTASAYGIDRKILFGHRVVRAAWSSTRARWTVDIEVGPDRELVSWTCRFLHLCTGYFSYDSGYQVEFPGQRDFRGPVVHPQHWPEDLDYRGKRVVVIGSGATAVTLVPAMAELAAHVTMVQRSPSYIMARPVYDTLANALRAVLPARLAHRIARGKNIGLTVLTYTLMRRWPRRGAAVIKAGIARAVGDAVPIDPHFTPAYDPWDQRLCMAADGDFFRALRERRATVVTDTVAGFSADGVRLASGADIPADIVVTATGLRMIAIGDIALTVDGVRVRPGDTFVYKGMMLGGVPNLAWSVGYINASWTLRADLTARYVCRLINYLDRHGYAWCLPRPPAGERPAGPLLSLTSGYVRRAAGALPRQGARPRWRVRDNYLADLVAIRLGRLRDPDMVFGTGAAVQPAPPVGWS